MKQPSKQKKTWKSKSKSENAKVKVFVHIIMELYRLMVLHWSIFTLSTQLILCASIYSSEWSFFCCFLNAKNFRFLTSWEEKTLKPISRDCSWENSWKVVIVMFEMQLRKTWNREIRCDKNYQKLIKAIRRVKLTRLPLFMSIQHASWSLIIIL